MAIVELSNVSKKYGSVQAMDGISFSIPSGVVFALLGENGAGKTTTIKTMLGLEHPDSGTIKILGLEPTANDVQIRRQIGYVPDAPALYGWMKVSEIGWFTSGFYPTGFYDHFVKLAGDFELPLDVKIKTLSKGGHAKVALALAMAHQPDLLILDEPTSGLDTLVRRKFLESMVDVAAANRTVFLSSHQIPEVERVADYVAIVNEGQIRVCDRLETLKQEIEQWVITVSNPNISLPVFDACLLSRQGEGKKRQQVFVRKPDPNLLWQLRDIEGVKEVEVNTPSLEDIFVAYLGSQIRQIPESGVESSTAETNVGGCNLEKGGG
ncbi:MAG: ABC transporter ATP-binding protein [Mariniblastus sp.]